MPLASLRTYVLKVEVVTPLVAGGADGSGTTEAQLLREGLRPPTVRGQLRWWFRALASGLLGGDHDATLRSETELFGTVAGDLGSASPVWVRARPFPQNARVGKVPLRMNDPQPVGNQRQAPLRPAILPGAQTEVELTARPAAAARALWSLWLALMLGGFGARSRRGFGSLRVLAPERVEEVPFVYPSARPEQVAAFLARTLAAASAALLGGARPSRNARAATGRDLPMEVWPVGSPDACGLWAVAPAAEGAWPDWQRAMNGMRELYRTLKREVRAPSLPPLGRPSIGSAAGPFGRDPSPLVLQLKRAADGGFFGLVLALDDRGPDGKHRYFRPDAGSGGPQGVPAVRTVVERLRAFRAVEVAAP